MMAAAHVQEAVGAVYPHDAIWDALRQVEDPEMGISIVDMGMIVSASRADNIARVALTYTAMGCPATEMIENDMRIALSRVPGITSVEIDVVWDPVWTKRRLTEEGRDALQMIGIAV